MKTGEVFRKNKTGTRLATAHSPAEIFIISKTFLNFGNPVKKEYREIKINVYFLSNSIVSWYNVNLFSHRVQPTQTDWWDIVDDMRATPCLGGW